jgi:hypothetical protein
MNYKSLVKLSNTIGLVSIILLVYWVFAYICITVFGLKVFRENMTETFFMSVMGILALMFGSLIVNIMFNLTRIAEKHNLDDVSEQKASSRKLGFLFLLLFPLIAAILFGGDYLTKQKKEKMLIASAQGIMEKNQEKSERLLNYVFTENWLLETDGILDIYAKTDKNCPYVTLIMPDSIDQTQVYLGFRDYSGSLKDTLQPQKKEFMLATDQQEREYLHQVFFQNLDKPRFTANAGTYQLFYPYSKNGKRIVLYFSDYQRYGKNGSY